MDPYEEAMKQRAQRGVCSLPEAAPRAGELPTVQHAKQAAGSAVRIVERGTYRPRPPPPPPMGGAVGDAGSLEPALRASVTAPPAGRPRPNPRTKLIC